MTKIKICGITNLEDASFAIEKGAEYIGFIFASSPRQLIKGQAKKIIDACPNFQAWVGVFMNGKKRTIEELLEGLPIKILQFHGAETPAFCNYFINRGYQVIKTIPVKGRHFLLDPAAYDRVSYFLFDTVDRGRTGGTGKVFSWKGVPKEKFQKLNGKVFLSGGLTPKNVSDAIQIIQPYCVDVSSGVEESPGKKDKARLEAFIQRAKC